MAQVISDWLCVCSAGKATDGRNIEKEWLISAAKNYDREKYTAMIWPYHEENIDNRQFTLNYGMVDSLDYREEDGIGKLYARLEPNHYLLDLNKDGQKLFTSAEFTHNFAGGTETYFDGIVVTDIPASLYTEKLRFTSKNRQNAPLRGAPMCFTLQSQAPIVTPEPQRVSLTSKLQGETAITPVKQEKSNMTIEELQTQYAAMGEQIRALVAAATGETTDTPDEAVSEVADIAADLAEQAAQMQDAAEDLEANPDDTVMKDEFTYRKKELVRTLLTYAEQLDDTPRRNRRQRRLQLTSRRQQRPQRRPAPVTRPAAQTAPIVQPVSDTTHLTAQIDALAGQMNTITEKFTRLENTRQTPVISGAPVTQQTVSAV